VHYVPDHVKFNHKRHVRAGFACQTCHGPVETMDRVYQYSSLKMGWCVSLSSPEPRQSQPSGQHGLSGLPATQKAPCPTPSSSNAAISSSSSVSASRHRVASCAPHPTEKLIPYLIAPEDVLPGVPYFYSTACRECPAGCGMVVRTREGRAIKLEGNPQHPLGQGGLCARGQAGLQGLARIPTASRRRSSATASRGRA
jgi:hypothetical protein